MNLILLILAGVFVNNYVMSQFLGICPFLGVSKKVDTAAGMGMAVIFVMSLAAAAAWLVYNLILVPLNIVYLYNIAFILLIASLVSGSGCIPAPDHNKLCGTGCSRNKYAEGLQLHRIRSERSWWCGRFRTGNHSVRRYS